MLNKLTEIKELCDKFGDIICNIIELVERFKAVFSKNVVQNKDTSMEE